ncbi:probable ribosomal protein S11, mitochondrial [Lolium rigidum]|uniref:probable ribosomal protein S11, mitochondrial n=1 Tax=Lolium rigidum TaxID=89674 RepID=UPI001F5D7E3F|nr:probable ribosomal protein S11, mitochondrial [Lolium rigidum]
MAARTLARALLRPALAQRVPPIGKGLANGGDPMSRVMQIRKLNDGINRPFAENEFAGGDRMGGIGGITGGDRMGGTGGITDGDRMGGFSSGERRSIFNVGDRMGGFNDGDRMGGNGGFTPGGRMAGGFTPDVRMGGNGGFAPAGRMAGGFTPGGRTGRFNMDLLQPTGQRVKRDVLHITQKGKKTFVTVTDIKGNRKAGASAGCLEDRKGRSRLARYAGEATGEHMGRAARKMGIKSVVVRVKGYSFFRKKKKIVMGFADGFRGERVRTQTPIMYIHDVTQLAHNGCRLPKKTRK